MEVADMQRIARATGMIGKRDFCMERRKVLMNAMYHCPLENQKAFSKSPPSLRTLAQSGA
jgi:hypothetical protein